MLGSRNKTNPTMRVAVLAMALLQIGASVVFPTADAVLEAKTVGAPAHVESPGNEDCATHHDHLFCQVVRSLSSARVATPQREATLSALPILRLEPRSEASAIAYGAVLPGTAHPRAPPLV
jgi:hypothetical protein